jgi:hypothetical protein
MVDQTLQLNILRTMGSDAFNAPNSKGIIQFIDKLGSEKKLAELMDTFFKAGWVKKTCYRVNDNGGILIEDLGKKNLTYLGLAVLNEGQQAIDNMTIEVPHDMVKTLAKMIEHADLTEREKARLLLQLQEKGAESILSQSINFTMGNANAVVGMLNAWAKSLNQA